MSPFMIILIALNSECLVAVPAGVWFFARVSAVVHDDVLFVVGRLVTHGALVNHSPLQVFVLHVLPQPVLPGVTLLTAYVCAFVFSMSCLGYRSMRCV